MMRENFMRCTFAAFHGAPSRMKFYAGQAQSHMGYGVGALPESFFK